MRDEVLKSLLKGLEQAFDRGHYAAAKSIVQDIRKVLGK